MSSENPDMVGDLHLDIAEAYMSIEDYSAAKPLLAKLVSSAEYNKVGSSKLFSVLQKSNVLNVVIGISFM